MNDAKLIAARKMYESRADALSHVIAKITPQLDATTVELLLVVINAYAGARGGLDAELREIKVRQDIENAVMRALRKAHAP